LRHDAGLLGAALAAPLALLTPNALAVSRAATVLLATGSSAAEMRVGERLGAELSSAGYQVHPADEVSDAACTPQSSIARSLESYGESAWVQVSGSEAAARLSVLLCYRDTTGHLSQSLLQIAPGDVDRGALASVEALNGLRAEPSPAPAAPCASAKVEPALPRPSLHNALAAGGAVLFDPLGIGPILGVTGGLESSISQRLSLHLDVFAPVRAQRLERADRTLEVDVAWLRAGPTLSWPLWITNVNASFSAGPALVWADSHAQAPLIGGARRSTAFVISAGGALELPRDAAWFLRAYYEVGTILPRINIATSPTDTEHLGPLLFQLGATLGIRWSG
jgi:hypothetical protein